MASVKENWFIRKRGSYLPSSGKGYVLYLLYVAYDVVLVIDWYKNSRTLWHLLTNVIPLVIAMAIVMQYLASRHTNKHA
jgi:hypothetical protein